MYGKHEKKLALAHLAKVKTKRARGNASDVKRIHENYALIHP
jgi:hypothetical protein